MVTAMVTMIAEVQSAKLLESSVSGIRQKAGPRPGEDQAPCMVPCPLEIFHKQPLVAQFRMAGLVRAAHWQRGNNTLY